MLNFMIKGGGVKLFGVLYVGIGLSVKDSFVGLKDV